MPGGQEKVRLNPTGGAALSPLDTNPTKLNQRVV